MKEQGAYDDAIFEENDLRAANAIAPRQSDRTRAAAQIDMHLEISHHVKLRACV
ncbi:hypothetical protein ACVINW_004135 [Bradyrhizobium sp. USDA 4461]